MEQPLDVKLQLIQHHATMARLLPSELLEAEVERSAGELTDAHLLELAQGDYKRVAGQFIDGFGLSQSNCRNVCGSAAGSLNGLRRRWRPLSVARWPRRPTSCSGSMASMCTGSR